MEENLTYKIMNIKTRKILPCAEKSLILNNVNLFFSFMQHSGQYSSFVFKDLKNNQYFNTLKNLFILKRNSFE